MEEKNKQRRSDGASDGKEEEVGMPNPRTSSNSNRASIILVAIERERLVLARGNLSAIVPKI